LEELVLFRFWFASLFQGNCYLSTVNFLRLSIAIVPSFIVYHSTLAEGRNHWGDLGVDGWINLGWISRRWDVGIWTGLGWPRIEI